MEKHWRENDKPNKDKDGLGWRRFKMRIYKRQTCANHEGKNLQIQTPNTVDVN